VEIVEKPLVEESVGPTSVSVVDVAGGSVVAGVLVARVVESELVVIVLSAGRPASVGESELVEEVVPEVVSSRMSDVVWLGGLTVVCVGRSEVV
jgi:hypothetical protein